MSKLQVSSLHLISYLILFLFGCCTARFTGNWGYCKTDTLSEWDIFGSSQLPLREDSEWNNCDVFEDMGGIIWDTVDDPKRKTLRILGSNNSTSGPPFTQPRIEGDLSGLKLTLVMADLDWPSRIASSVGAEVVQWMVVNIPHNSFLRGNIYDGGVEWVKYLPPLAQDNTDYHRVVFLVYAQSGDLSVKAGDWYPLSDCFCNSPPCAGCPDLMRRMNFNTKKFAEKYGLRGPVGGSFYLVDSGSSLHVNKLLFIGISYLFIFSYSF